jgi:hypothetical protein
MDNDQGLTYEVVKGNTVPRITTIRGQVVPPGAISSTVASETNIRTMSDLSVKTVVSAFQWAKKSHGQG